MFRRWSTFLWHRQVDIVGFIFEAELRVVVDCGRRRRGRHGKRRGEALKILLSLPMLMYVCGSLSWSGGKDLQEEVDRVVQGSSGGRAIKAQYCMMESAPRTCLAQ